MAKWWPNFLPQNSIDDLLFDHDYIGGRLSKMFLQNHGSMAALRARAKDAGGASQYSCQEK